jgi:hypothetical protein
MDWLKHAWNSHILKERMQHLDDCRLVDAEYKRCLQQGPSSDHTKMKNKYLRLYNWPKEANSCETLEHAVWACRAAALGCGDAVRQTRDCFVKEKGIVPADYEERKKATTGSSQRKWWWFFRTVAPLPVEQPAGPCRDVQRTLGDCVAKNLRDLQARVERQKQIEKKKAREATSQ